MNLIEAVTEMKKGNVVKGSNLIIYRIKDRTIEYFYESNWTKTGLSVLELSELTFEITETEKKETLSDKIVISEKIRVDMPCNSYATVFGDTEVIRIGDIKEFIDTILNHCYTRADPEVAEYIKELAGDKFK